ncbi:ATP-binding protein [Frigoribacterium salinisoli]
MRRVLVAARGLAAVRVVEACADHGVESVAVWSPEDVDARHAQLATSAWSLPVGEPGQGRDPYLDLDALLDVAARAGADAFHPGTGALAESPEAARRVADAGLTWIGADPGTLELLGDELAARGVAEEAGVPLVVASSGAVATSAQVVAFAQRHGLPVALKAASGTGTTGLRVVRRLDEIGDLLEAVVQEGVRSTGRGECLVEQYLDRPRHVEVQLVGDASGEVVVLGTREASVQRRHRPLVVEAPAPSLTPEQQQAITAGARDVAVAAGLRGLCTVEFLVAQSGVASFLEASPCLTDRGAATEHATGVDLVRQQLLVADGQPLDVDATPHVDRCAIDWLVVAEDPGRGFVPAPARLERLEAPGGHGVRTDLAVAQGGLLPRGREGEVMRCVVSGRDRQEALRRSRRALASAVVTGPTTVLPFHRLLVDDPAFVGDEDGHRVHTRWVEWECDGLDALARPTPWPGWSPALPAEGAPPAS